VTDWGGLPNDLRTGGARSMRIEETLKQHWSLRVVQIQQGGTMRTQLVLLLTSTHQHLQLTL
jgi:hypothetical protein